MSVCDLVGVSVMPMPSLEMSSPELFLRIVCRFLVLYVSSLLELK